MNRPTIAMLGRIAALLIVGALLAGTANALSPVGLAWSPMKTVAAADPSTQLKQRATEHGIAVVDLPQARRIVEAGDHVVLDARKQSRYAKGHIPGAISMPVGRAGEVYESLQLLLPAPQPVLVYCSGGACDDSLALGKFLRRQGLKHIKLFVGGMEAWRQAGLDEATGL